MKVSVFFTLLALSASFVHLDAAVIREDDGIQEDKLWKDVQPAYLNKAEKTMQSLGKLLQGELSLSSAEEREKVLDVIKVLATNHEAEEGNEEYFISWFVNFWKERLPQYVRENLSG
uniref:Uncharacterized protein n=1 Tax=Rhipicephalus zambeziensis TaxID=60191 RepID=A0A224YHS2_9ACAR